jgi:hypothetical protein
MTLPSQTPPARRDPLANYARPPAIAAAWVCLVGLATAVFFTPRGAEAQPTVHDLVGFALALAIAGSATAAAAFAVGGRWRWALEVAASVILASLLIALLVAYFFWFDIRYARSRLGYWDFLRYQRMAHDWAILVPGFLVPLGGAVGIGLGTITGLLVRLARRRPRLAGTIALALLIGCASEPGQHFVLTLMTEGGRMLRNYLVGWSVSDDEIVASGMLFGAIAGGVIAGLSMHLRWSGSPGPVSTVPNPIQESSPWPLR